MRSALHGKDRFALAVFLWLLCSPFTSHAQQIRVSGEVAAGFGSVKFDETATRSVDGVGEATLNFSARRGPVFAQIEIGFTESSQEPGGAEHELVWSPTAGFSVTLSGSSLEMEATESNISVVNAPGGPVGDEEANLDFSGTGLIDLEFSAEDFAIGLALLDGCVPECGYLLETTSPEPFHPDAERMTAMLHLMGQAGALTYKTYLARSKGTFADSSLGGSGFGGGVGMVYETEIFKVALDYSLATIECSGEGREPPCSGDNELAQYGFSAEVFGFGVHYYFGEDNLGADNEEKTNVDLVYLFEAGGAKLGPEFRLTRTQLSGEGATTATFLLFGAFFEF